MGRGRMGGGEVLEVVVLLRYWGCGGSDGFILPKTDRKFNSE